MATAKFKLEKFEDISFSLWRINFRHYKVECLKLKNKGKDNKSSSSSMVGVIEEKFDGSELVHVVSISDCRFNDTWVLNSVCSCHMCHKKYWFSIYESINGDLVLIKNDVACKIVAIDN
jgi:hypothetical protein